jgi:hypothetical protein
MAHRRSTASMIWLGSSPVPAAICLEADPTHLVPVLAHEPADGLQPDPIPRPSSGRRYGML